MANPDFSLLRQRIDGELILPGQPRYTEARRVWNGLIDRHPSAILRCASTSDVSQGLAFATANNFPVAVRGGAHSVAGYGTVDGGLVLDLAAMHEVTVDADNRTVTVGGGATWGQVDAATQQFGLAVPGGVFSRTGVGGLTLGGGYGWIRNTYGLSCASLLGAEIVTADSAVVTTHQAHHPDLLWALRGGGGNVGVVTRFIFRLHPVGPDVFFLSVMHDARGDGGVLGLKAFREFCARAPDEVGLAASLGVVPADAEGFSAEMTGVPFISFAGVFVGDPAVGERLLRPLREFGNPLRDSSAVMPYTEVQQVFDADYPDGDRYYWKSLHVNRLDDTALGLLAQAGANTVSDLSTIDVMHLSGAARRPIDGALPATPASFLVNAEANWAEPRSDAANIAWARALVESLHPFSPGSGYLNFAGLQEEGDELIRSSFGPNYARLARIKTEWDPHNVFRLNQNVPPSPVSARRTPRTRS